MLPPIYRFVRRITELFDGIDTHCQHCGNPLETRGTVFCSEQCMWDSDGDRVM